MTTCLVNLAYLDPARVGGVGRIAHEVGQLLAECGTQSTETRVIFVVGWRFAGEFSQWLEQSAVVVPFITRHDLRLTIQLLKPDIVVSPLFGLEPFQDVKAIHIAGMPDALALDHPELFSGADLAYRRQVYDHLQRATRVVTLSNHARERLLHHTKLQPEQIAVVRLGAEPQMSPQPTRIPNLPQRYLFYPANFWPHKRHDLLFRIMSQVWEQQPDLHLVLTGGRSEADKQGLQQLMAQYHCPAEKVHDFGYVDDGTLTLLYQKAEALLFVSQYEGFGMPLLEAMLQSCPVICAPLASIPEAVGEAALLVNSEDAEDWVKAIVDDLPQKRDQLIIAGRAQAAQFTWAKTRDGWREVIAEAGLKCEASKQLSHESFEIIKKMQPLLQHMSQLAASAARSRIRQIALLPVIFSIQIRLLILARTYQNSDA